jgi:hypothetical protein
MKYVAKQSKIPTINGLNLQTRVKQLFKSHYVSEQETIADRVIEMQNKLKTDFSKFSLEQKIQVFHKENEDIFKETEYEGHSPRELTKKMSALIMQ